MSDLYRLVYASKNLLHGTDAEITAAVRQIMEASQRNNSKVEVTGALMFNAGAFAQVLEGPRRAVEATFERIQCDDRHGDVTVLQCGPTESRGFANWSMAFVGQSARGQDRFSSLAAESGFDLSRLDGDTVFAMLHGLVLEEEDIPLTDSNVLTAELPKSHGATGLDVEQVRTEIAQVRQTGATPRTASTAGAQRTSAVENGLQGSHPTEDPNRNSKGAIASALQVLKRALADERQRTGELRTEIDALQIALASSEDQLDALREERDLWAERARLLATAMSQEAGDVRKAAHRSGSSEMRLVVGARS